MVESSSELGTNAQSTIGPVLAGLRWDSDGQDWPNREASHFLEAGGLRWHLQLMGSGPPLLLLHGTGASTHSWRNLMPRLGRRFTVLAPDLPGHGFTQYGGPLELTLPGMATALRGLLRRLQLEPKLALGHSAGAAVMAHMSLDGLLPAAALVSVNGALLPLRGMPGPLFSPIARFLATNRLAPRLLAWTARRRSLVERMLENTGSRLDCRDVDLYVRLARCPEHVSSALRMMAGWKLEPLRRELPRLRAPLLLMIGTADRTVSPTEAERLRALVPHARLSPLPGLGHLAHEERPDWVAERVQHFAAEVARNHDDRFSVGGAGL